MSWCKLHSQSVKSDVFQDADLWRFWCYLLMRTSRHGNSFSIGRHMVTVAAGECVIGRKQAAIDCHTTEQRVRTMTKRLEAMGNLTTKPTKIATIITICNWGSYQSGQPTKQPAKQPATNQQPTNKQPLSREKEEQKEVALSLSKYLLDSESAATGRKLTSQPHNGVGPIVALMNKGVTEAQARMAVDWLCGPNKGSGYTIEVQSGKALREKWDKIQTAMAKRQGNLPLGYNPKTNRDAEGKPVLAY